MDKKYKILIAIILGFVLILSFLLGYILNNKNITVKFKDPFNYKNMPQNSQLLPKNVPTIKSLHDYKIRSGTGLGKDFNVYINTLDYITSFDKNSDSGSQIITQGNNIITLEHIPVKTNQYNLIFIPNQELVNNMDEKMLLLPGKVRLVLCKSKYAQKIFENFKRKFNCSWDVSSFIFPPVLTTKFYSYPKDRNIFFHPAGKSWMKNTSTVIKTWSHNPSWPLLIITCSDDCIKYHNNINNSTNIKVYNFLDKKDLYTLQKHCGYVIMPSSCEGFGHSAYEALENGNLLITTDIPPLNEMLKDKINCMMIKPKSNVYLGTKNNDNFEWLSHLSKNIGLMGSYCVDVAINDIEEAVNNSIKLSDSYYNKIRLNAVNDLHNMILTGKESVRNAFYKAGLEVK
jgi:glycosyltransferase involved in cell wall biosynthesis